MKPITPPWRDGLQICRTARHGWPPNSLAWLIIWLTLLFSCAKPAWAESFPADAGALNVRDFGARGDGQADDTAAFLAAVAASGGDTGATFWKDKIVFVPNGTYRISAPILKRYANGHFASGLILVGESRDRTILRLPDNAAGYGDAQNPKAVVFTSSKLLNASPTDGNKDYLGKGEGNDAYMNFIENLTIDVGSGNPGAIALDYLGNNSGAIRNVLLRAGSGSGAVGLSMTRKWPGPTLIQHLTVEGFATGIATAETEYGLTFDHLILRNQTVAAISNRQNVLSIRDLQISGPTPLIINSGDRAFLAIDGGSAAVNSVTSLIRNEGIATLRNMRLGADVQSGTLRGGEWQPMDLPSWLVGMSDAPATPTGGTWVSVAAYGATGTSEEDATDALRQAFASGASTIYLPHGTYAIRDGIEIPASVQRIVGMNSTMRVLTQRTPSFARTSGMLRAAGSGAPLFIERLAFDNSNLGAQVAVELSGGRDLVMRDIVSAGVTMLDRTAAGGRAFLENMCCGLLKLAGPQPVYARQFNTEGGGTRITNDGSPLAILGLKTEGITTVLDNRAGARTDIFGGLVYIVRDGVGPETPAIRNSNSWLSAALVEESLRSGSRYQIYVERDPADSRGAIPVTAFPERGYGRFIPHLTDAPANSP
jgi:hypothetical protein